MAKKKAEKVADKSEIAEVIRERWAGNPPKTAKERKADQEKPLVGEVVVIMGVPKEDNYNARTIIAALAEPLRNAYDYLDVVKIKGVDLNAPAMYATKEGDKEMVDYVNTGEGRAVMALTMSQYDRYRDRTAIEEQDHFAKMTPDELKTEDQKRRDHLRKAIDDVSRADEKRRGEAVVHAFDIAQRWSTLPDLTPRERVHGAVHDMYHHHGAQEMRDEHGRFVKANPGNDYAAHYEAHFGNEIKARSIRAAKELFKN